MGKGSKKKHEQRSAAPNPKRSKPSSSKSASKPASKPTKKPSLPIPQAPSPSQSSTDSDGVLLSLYRSKLLELAKSHAALLKKVEIDAATSTGQNDLISFSQLSDASHTSPPSSPLPPPPTTTTTTTKKIQQAQSSDLFSQPDENFVNEMDNWLQVHDANSRLSLASSIGETPNFSQTSHLTHPTSNQSLPPPPPSLPLSPNVRVGVGVLIKRKSSKKVHAGIRKGSHGAGTLALPGGHLEFGESWETCAIREVDEECGIDISGSPLRLVHVTNDPMLSENKHYITLFMGCVVEDDVKFVNAEPHKCEGWEEYSFDELESSGKLFGPLERLIQQKPKSFSDFLNG